MKAIEAIEAIEKNPTLKERIINAGKEAGFAALDAAVDMDNNLYYNLVVHLNVYTILMKMVSKMGL